MHKLFETILNAEIGNGKVYTPTYNASDRLNYRGEGWSSGPGDKWQDVNSHNVPGSKRRMIKDVIDELSPKEKQALNAFNPNPVDIAIDVENGDAEVTFPNGTEKTVNI